MMDFSKKYPSKEIPNEFNELVSEIGRRMIGFEDLRDNDTFNIFLNRLKVEPQLDSEEDSNTTDSDNSNADKDQTKPKSKKEPAKKAATNKALAISNNDPRFIIATLKKLKIFGEKREKIVALQNEAIRLKTIENYPYSFCFLLRSMFELSAMAYCNENKIPIHKIKDGKKIEARLIDILKAANKHLIVNADIDSVTQRKLHGAITELSKPEGLLSVRSLNQLVHNPDFSTHGSHLASVFANIFPLLEMLNS